MARPAANMHVSHGWRGILEGPGFFNFFQFITGAHSWKRRIIRDHLKPVPGARILDIGCGTGSVLGILGNRMEIDYVGFDVNEEYIRHAKQKHPAGKIYCSTIANLPKAEVNFDYALAVGVFHHLDEAAGMMIVDELKQRLKPGGIFMMAEPVWTQHQSALEKYLMKKDRGQNIRDETGYLDLVKKGFSNVKCELIYDSHLIPWTVALIKCRL